jgi:hypothetical protein
MKKASSKAGTTTSIPASPMIRSSASMNASVSLVAEG